MDSKARMSGGVMCETECFFVFWVLSVPPFFLSLCCDDPASISPRWSNCEYCVFHLGCNQLNLPETRLQSCWKDFNLWRSTTSTESNPSENHSTIHLPEKLEPMSIKKYWFHWWGKCVKTTLDFWSKESFPMLWKSFHVYVAVSVMHFTHFTRHVWVEIIAAICLPSISATNITPTSGYWAKKVQNGQNTNKWVLSKESNDKNLLCCIAWWSISLSHNIIPCLAFTTFVFDISFHLFAAWCGWFREECGRGRSFQMAQLCQLCQLSLFIVQPVHLQPSPTIPSPTIPSPTNSSPTIPPTFPTFPTISSHLPPSSNLSQQNRPLVWFQSRLRMI